MTEQNPVFDISSFELRDYTNPWLTADQTEQVTLTESRVNGQLDFLAQMLGWNGPNYWGNLPATVSQKRQLLGGTFGVYNSYIIPKIYEIRNWDNKIVVDRLQFLSPGRQTQIARILLGENVYTIRSVDVEGDKYVVSIGELTQEFFDQIAANVPLRLDIPTYRPAPFYRPTVGASGDYSFVCGNSGSDLVIYPGYDSNKQFPLRFPILFAGSVYYFDQPIYLSLDSSLQVEVAPSYDEEQGKWYFQVPESLTEPAGLTGYLAWANSNAVEANNYSLPITIRPWTDKSDWNTIPTLDNFRGIWGNKGGDLPFNFVFDSLSIHGFDEANSIYFPPLQTALDFNQIVNYIYYQKTTVSELAPGDPNYGDLWWNDTTGALSVWIPNETSCAAWVEIDYRQEPRQVPTAQVVYPDVATFQANAGSLTVGVVVYIEDITGLGISNNVIGVQGTLSSPGTLVLHKDSAGPYWTPDSFSYANVADFEVDAPLLPFKVPVTVYNADGLAPSGLTYSVSNLGITISGDYDILLRKYYTNNTWEIYPDSILKYIAFSALFGTSQQGAMWWDYANTDPNTRAAAIYFSSPSPLTGVSIVAPGVGLPTGVATLVDMVSLSGQGGGAKLDITVSGTGQVTAVVVPPSPIFPFPNEQGDKYQIGDILTPNPDTFPQLVGCTFEVTSTASQAWAAVNMHPQMGAPAPSLDLGVVLFYCNGDLLTENQGYVTDDFVFTYASNSVTGQYEFSYHPYTLAAKAQLPTITISDDVTTTYRADITDLVFSGVTYYMSPNVFDAETPLRLWKGQDLQVAETVAHLVEDNYINPLLADLNNGPGPENWERYFVRLPLDYGRNEAVWQKVALTCQDFGYWGSSVEPESMRCPPEDDVPAIYEELFLYDEPISDYTYVYCEPYLYSNIAYSFSVESGLYQNSGVFPTSDIPFDEFSEAELIEYDPLHNRQADVTSPVGKGYGDWLGQYVNINPCESLTGFLETDLLNRGVTPVAAPTWDASIYKYAPTCQNAKASYSVDANHYKIGYCYFVADASAAEDAFFDITQEASWRYPVTQPKTLYLTPR
jgi:hypothetical protein